MIFLPPWRGKVRMGGQIPLLPFPLLRLEGRVREGWPPDPQSRVRVHRTVKEREPLRVRSRDQVVPQPLLALILPTRQSEKSAFEDA